jgi:hypothetical protein
MGSPPPPVQHRYCSVIKQICTSCGRYIASYILLITVPQVRVHIPQCSAVISFRTPVYHTSEVRTTAMLVLLLAGNTNSEPGSTVSIVSSYGLDDRTIEVRSPTEAEDFSSSLCIQTLYNGYHGYFPRG